MEPHENVLCANGRAATPCPLYSDDNSIAAFTGRFDGRMSTLTYGLPVVIPTPAASES